MSNQKRVLITGATTGIGRSLVEPMAEMGHIIAGCGRSQSNIKELSTTLSSPHSFHVADVTKWDEVLTWSQEVLKQGVPDLVINNAGVINKNANLWEVSDEEFSKVMSVNICGTANVIRAFLPAMIKNRNGVVVNMSSGWGRSTAPEVAPYCASKWAIEGLTKALAQELPPGLAAVAVNPGIIDTDMLRSCWGDAAASCPNPEEWAKTAVGFMLSLTEKDNGASLSVM